MTASLPDDELRRRVQELGRQEAAGAPSWDRVVRDRRTRPAGWRRPALALAGVLVVAAIAWWGPMGPPPADRPVQIASSDPVLDPWVLPTDGLLADTWEGTGKSDVERLSREIEGLLER
jgi:hypothetical protein